MNNLIPALKYFYTEMAQATSPLTLLDKASHVTLSTSRRHLRKRRESEILGNICMSTTVHLSDSLPKERTASTQNVHEYHQ